MSQFVRREDFIPYNLPDITQAEIDEVVDTLRSGWIAKGPRTLKFEKEFAEYLGAKHAIAVNSCTAALHVSLLTQNIGPGDEVITTPMTFASTASTILHCGAKPVFADIDYRTGCIDPEEIAKKITPHTKAIVPVHYSGQVCDLDRIYELADEHNLYVSEDAAHALWSRYKGRLIGNKLRGAASYSFYATKNLATGDGGMLVTDRDDIAERARILVGQGMSHNAWNRYAKGGSWKYDIVEPGYKYNVFEYQRDFFQVYAEMRSRKLLPILCGGTGMYLESVLKGYKHLPVPENPDLRERLKDKSLEELTEILEEDDRVLCMLSDCVLECPDAGRVPGISANMIASVEKIDLSDPGRETVTIGRMCEENEGVDLETYPLPYFLRAWDAGERRMLVLQGGDETWT